MQSEFVTLAQLAIEFGLHRTNVQKYVRRHGFSPIMVRTPESRRQLTLALTADEAEAVRELRQTEGFIDSFTPARSIPQNDIQNVQNGEGYFYIIQIVPELAPNRIKLGFAGDVQARLKSHYTLAPTAIIVKSWPCKRSWESIAITSITRTECNCIGGEVFECQDLSRLIDRADEFFSIMPNT